MTPEARAERGKLAQRLEKWATMNAEDFDASFNNDMAEAAAVLRALPCDESPAALSPDAREALTWLAELDGGLPRAPMPVAGSEECYPGPDVPTRVSRAAVRALGREPVDKPEGLRMPIAQRLLWWRGKIQAHLLSSAYLPQASPDGELLFDLLEQAASKLAVERQVHDGN